MTHYPAIPYFVHMIELDTPFILECAVHGFLLESTNIPTIEYTAYGHGKEAGSHTMTLVNEVTGIIFDLKGFYERNT